jgi:hypothetical protein
MKKFNLVALILLLPGFVLGAKVIPLPDLLNPNSIIVHQDQVYIVQSPSILIYSLKDFILKKKFGRIGEGPEEFKLFPNMPLLIDVQGGEIIAKSMGKISYFTTDGKFKKEVKVKGGFIMAMKAFGNFLAGIEGIQENNMRYLGMTIYDNQLNKIARVFKVADSVQRGKGMQFLSVPQAFDHSFAVSGDKLFLAWEKEFKISVFDTTGKKLYTIAREGEKLALTGEYKEKVIEHLKTDPNTKPYFEFLKPIRFPQYFPAIREMRISDGKVYVLTYKTQQDKTQCFVFDIKGKLLEEVYLPLKSMNVTVFFPFAIKEGKVYQLVEDIEKEAWEFHINLPGQ